MDEQIGMVLNNEFYGTEDELVELSDEIAVLHMAINDIPVGRLVEFIKQN